VGHQVITNAISKRPPGWAVDPINHSMFTVFFGQFVGHDFDSNSFNPAPTAASDPNAELMMLLIPKAEPDGTPDETCAFPIAFNFIPYAPKVHVCMVQIREVGHVAYLPLWQRRRGMERTLDEEGCGALSLQSGIREGS
jgi:hypothetical protein